MAEEQALDACKILAFKNNPIRPWLDGECPVHPDVLVNVWFRDGSCTTTPITAADYDWVYAETYPRDIIAYQIVDQEIP